MLSVCGDCRRANRSSCELVTMATVEIIQCDECGAVKKEVNHWFKAFAASTNASLMFFQWLQNSPGIDLCGQECATKVLQRWMATGKLEGA